MSITERLKAELWARYGAAQHPAEWDGHTYGGGKISQRFWEYFIAIELLNLTADSVVLDIGGGSPATGLSLFPRLLASAGISVVVVDTNFGTIQDHEVEGVSLVRHLADYDTLCAAVRSHRPTHVSSISVMEHANAAAQRGIFDAIETAFTGLAAVFTLEFHETTNYFEQQLTTASLSQAVSGLKRYYLDRIEKSPLHCVNALREEKRLWYPLALRFARGSSN